MLNRSRPIAVAVLVPLLLVAGLSLLPGLLGEASDADLDGEVALLAETCITSAARHDRELRVGREQLTEAIEEALAGGATASATFRSVCRAATSR